MKIRLHVLYAFYSGSYHTNINEVTFYWTFEYNLVR